MTHAKDEYTRNGHEVTVQQVRGPDSDIGASEPSIWIDGKAGYIQQAIEEQFNPFDGMDYDDVKHLANWMADMEVLFCPKCNTLYNIEDSVSTGFAGHKCATCADADATCEDGGQHDYTCLNPSQKRNARVATKYKCDKCGYTKSTTPTG